jgi:NADH:ubiquinone oxidoreductase subunit 5 (subunit L)/multisubunit Na+/H+ antiporter MnhA subunit
MDINLLPWLIPAGPLLAFFIIVLITNRAKMIPASDHAYSGDGHHPSYGGMSVPVVQDWSRVLSIVVGMSGIISALLISWVVVGYALGMTDFGKKVIESSIPWLNNGASIFNMGVMVDPLTVVLLIMVPIACTMIFIYAIGYMAHDPRQARFFAYISLFAGAMLTLVVADNLLLLFVGWEIMGLCSFMLIGFWYEKPSAYKAAVKAFTTTRIADVMMLLGIAYLYASTGTLNFRDIMYYPAEGKAAVTADASHNTDAEHSTDDAAHSTDDAAHSTDDAAHSTDDAAHGGEGEHGGEHAETKALQLAAVPALIFGSWGVSAAGLIGMFLIIGTVGKSAQFPLHVWLPDAMEGPTPVSAMIHAAAMVSAGIYAVIRMFPLFEAGGHPHDGVFTAPLLLLAIVGALTALFAATIAVAQNDVKKVLAYSTISQLGFMMAALGIGGYIAAFFHLITHAFFKALLFMASGSVIHGMEHGHHHAHDHHDDDHDDSHTLHDGHHGGALPAGGGGGGHDSHGAHAHAADAHGHDAHGHDAHGHDAHGHDDTHGHKFDPQDMFNMGGLRHGMPVTFWTFVIGGLSLAGFPMITAGFWSKDEILLDAWYGVSNGYGPHAFVFVCLVLAAFLTAFYTARQLCLTFLGEARTDAAKHANLGQGVVSVTMTLPLIILAVFAVVAGYVGVHPDFPIFGWLFSSGGNPFFNFASGSLAVKPEKLAFNWVPVLFSFGISVGGLLLGWLIYGRKPLTAGQADPLQSTLGPLYNVLKHKYYFDELYDIAFIRPSQWFSKNVASEFIDRGVIDGTLHLIARVTTWIGDLFKVMNTWMIDGVGDGVPVGINRLGAFLRNSQTGRIQSYMLIALAVALIIGLVLAVSSGLLQAAP